MQNHFHLWCRHQVRVMTWLCDWNFMRLIGVYSHAESISSTITTSTLHYHHLRFLYNWNSMRLTYLYSHILSISSTITTSTLHYHHLRFRLYWNSMRLTSLYSHVQSISTMSIDTTMTLLSPPIPTLHFQWSSGMCVELKKEVWKIKPYRGSNPRGEGCPLVPSQEWLVEMCLEEMGRV